MTCRTDAALRGPVLRSERMKNSWRNAADISHRRFGMTGRVSASAVFLLIFGLFVAVRFWHLSYYCLDGDEIFSLNVARESWSSLLTPIIADLVHPPFAYILLKFWIGIGGDGLLWLRLLPTILSIGSVIPFLLLCRALRLESGVTSFALYLIAVNGYLIYWAHDIRMYSLVLLLTLFSLWLFVRFYQDVKIRTATIAGLAVVNLLLVYTHYFGFLVIGAQFVFLLIAARDRILLFGSGIVLWAAAFSPWAYLISREAAARDGFGHNLGWIARPGISEMAWYYATLNGDIEVPHTTLLGLMIFGLPAVFLLLRSRTAEVGDQGSSERGRWFLIAAAVLPVAAAFCASRVLPQSVWGDRHLIVSSIPYLIVVAAGIFDIRTKALRIGLLVIVSAWSGLAGYIKLGENLRPAWDKVTSQMVAAEPARDGEVPLYTYEEVVVPILDFYLIEKKGPDFRVQNVANADAMSGDHFWIALRTPAGRPDLITRETLSARGYRIGPEFTSSTPLETVTLIPVWKE